MVRHGAVTISKVRKKRELYFDGSFWGQSMAQLIPKFERYEENINFLACWKKLSFKRFELNLSVLLCKTTVTRAQRLFFLLLSITND